MPPTNQNPFFNVMPEVTDNAPLVNGVSTRPKPVIAEAGQPLATSIERPGLLQNKRLLLIIGAGVVFLIIVATLIWLIFLRQKSTPTAPNAVTPATQETPAVAGVTTDPAWLLQYFDAETCVELTKCGDEADPDRDGLKNLAEFENSTDPNNPDSDKDGLADGDELNIFGSNPLLNKSYPQGPYYDADFAKGGFSIQTDAKYTDSELTAIKDKVKEFGLHQPTMSTIGEATITLYDFSDPNAPALPANVDQSNQAKLDRDTLRIESIKKVGAALLKYREDKKTFPMVKDFVAMTDAIRPYNIVATNYNDPINLEQYIYGYQVSSDGSDFTLTYYSEAQNQLFKYKPVDAATDSAKQNSSGSDEKRKLDLESIRNALLIYSTSQQDPKSTKTYVFPTTEQYKSSLAKYLTVIPTDPTTKADYAYQVGPSFDTFTLKAILQNPPAGTTGYMCNQIECSMY